MEGYQLDGTFSLADATVNIVKSPSQLPTDFDKREYRERLYYNNIVIEERYLTSRYYE